MRTLKDKKKFGWGKVRKNHACKSFGISLHKDTRKFYQAKAREIAHKVLMHQPITMEDIRTAWVNPYVSVDKVFGMPYMWDGVGYYERWVKQIYDIINARIH